MSESTTPILDWQRTVLAVLHPCRRQWSELETTDKPDVRFCFDCCQTVVHVHTTAGVMQAAALRQCTYFEAHDAHGPFLGEIRIDGYRSSGPLAWED